MATKSIDQAINDSNAWARQQNAANNYTGTNYLLNQMDPGGGYHSIEDPARTAAGTKANLAGMGSLGKPTEKGATAWSSASPLSAFWSPTGSGWQEINEGMLSNPDVAQSVMRGAGNIGSPQYGAFSQLKSKIPTSVTQGIEGSSYSLAPDVLSKMWR